MSTSSLRGDPPAPRSSNARRIPRAKRHALAGEGPIVNRARAALRHVAEQFGTITETDPTTVSVRTPDGIPLVLSYDPGNYVFSRVYNLTITAPLPEDSPIPAGISLSHRERGGARYVRSAGAPASGGRAASGRLAQLNEALRDHVDGIDLLTSRVSDGGTGRSLTITPMGGSYVWVLIPPVFKATAFPAGEPQRILSLIREFRTWRPREAARSVTP